MERVQAPHFEIVWSISTKYEIGSEAEKLIHSWNKKIAGFLAPELCQHQLACHILHVGKRG